MEKLPLDSEIFTRGVEEIITREELKKLLASGKKLRIKHGLDATSPDLHLGHASSLWKIRALQEAGHRAVILLGDVTTTIGDPTGRLSQRPLLSPAAIKRNAASLKRGLKRILLTSPGVLEIHQNSEWYRRLRLGDFLKILSRVTHARLIERDMFRQRIGVGAEIHMNELIYPILQGYDSVMLRADLTIIGSDQLFNEHVGRSLQEKFGQPPQAIVALSILPGLDGGEKMSKSAGNYIGLGDSPQDQFGKTMRLLDSLIIPYLEVYTDVSLPEIKRWEEKLRAGENPMEAKFFLAEAIVRRYHGPLRARRERERFLSVFSQRRQPASMPEISVEHKLWDAVDFLMRTGLVFSRAEARRLLKQGAVKINGRTVRDPSGRLDIMGGTVIKVGKRRFLKIK